jgi:hypothetical protein
MVKGGKVCDKSMGLRGLYLFIFEVEVDIACLMIGLNGFLFGLWTIE